MFEDVAATASERAAARPGDHIVIAADVVMDRAFTIDAAPADVWPWLVQLGKRRAGWYLPRSIERFLPPARRAARQVDDRWQQLTVGDVIPDYGGRRASFEVVELEPQRCLVYSSRRGGALITWSIALERQDRAAARTRVFLRLRAAPVRRSSLVQHVGGLFDLITIAGMAAGLRERVAGG